MLADGFLTIASVKSLSASSKFPVREGNILISVKKKRKTGQVSLQASILLLGGEGHWEQQHKLSNWRLMPQIQWWNVFLLAAKKADKPSFIAAIASILFVEDSSLISSVTLEINPSY